MHISWPFLPDQMLAAPFTALEMALSFLPDESRYREVLWEATLAHVSEIPWYKDRSHKSLAAIPMLTGKDISDAEQLHHLYHPEIPRDVVFCSGGTSGRAKLMPHSYAQFTAMSMLEEATLDILKRHDDYTSFDGQAFTRVRLLESFHGPRFPWPTGRYVQHLALAGEDVSSLPVLRDVLTGSDRNPVRGRTATELIAAMPKLIAVASAIERTGCDLSESKVERIFAGGFSSSETRQKWFEQVFGGRFVELFGSTEVWQGNCQRCLACNFFHEPLTVIHEYLPSNFPEPYRELIVTTLVPFALTMPLLRYRTGDLVRLGPHCPIADKIGFDYVGRISDTRYFPESGLVLSPLPIAKALPSLTGIRRLPFDDLLERDLPLPEHLRWPVYRCAANPDGRMAIKIEAAADAPAKVESMRNQLFDKLAEIDTRIPSHVHVEFVPPGTLEAFAFH